jgi:phosphate transport system permease protein
MSNTLPEYRRTAWDAPAMKARIARRYGAERWFRRVGFAAVAVSAACLAGLLGSMAADGWRGFVETRVILSIDLSPEAFAIDRERLMGGQATAALNAAGLEDAVAMAAKTALGADGVDLISDNAWRSVRAAIVDDPGLVGSVTPFELPASYRLDRALTGEGPEALVTTANRLRDDGLIRRGPDWGFITGADATNPADVGIWGALKGSILTMLVTLALAFPVGILAAVYLEEFAPRNRWAEVIEVSINNLAAVPSIIFGLLGLAVFLNTLGLPRSAPLVGGLTLALMTMPVIVIAARTALKAVPPSIREAALGVGASPIQVVVDHLLPAALPGVLTGTIIGMARALGETAPLLMIGMRAFITTPPDSILSPASALPVQVFLWSDEVSRGFVEKTSAAIIVLLLTLLAMNALAVYLRNRFEIRW